jgi:hypothetical protein
MQAGPQFVAVCDFVMLSVEHIGTAVMMMRPPGQGLDVEQLMLITVFDDCSNVIMHIQDT